jgi:predicted DNA-binding transcriptional regulator AlpA
MSPKDKQQQRERREQRQPRRALRLPEVMRKVGLRKSQLFDSIRSGRLSETLQHPAKRARSRVG